MTVPVTSFIGRDNVSRISLYSDDQLINLDEWTRAVLTIKDSTAATVDTLDTDVVGDPIAKNPSGIDAQFGRVSPSLPAGVYVVKIDVYTATYTQGIRWPVDVELTMVAI